MCTDGEGIIYSQIFVNKIKWVSHDALCLFKARCVCQRRSIFLGFVGLLCRATSFKARFCCCWYIVNKKHVCVVCFVYCVFAQIVVSSDLWETYSWQLLFNSMLGILNYTTISIAHHIKFNHRIWKKYN